MATNAIRLLIAATCIWLGACARPLEMLESTNLRGDQQTSDLEGKDTCAKLKEVGIGMTTSQVLLACERKPRRTSDIITRDGKQVTVWSYDGSYLHFTDGKLVHIYSP